MLACNSLGIVEKRTPATRGIEDELELRECLAQTETSRVSSGTQSPSEALAESSERVVRNDSWLTTNEWRESLLRRMLAAGDILAVVFGGLSLGFLIGSNVNALFWTITLAPAWVVLAKLLGLYDRDQRSLRHLTIDEMPLLLTWALLGSLGVVLFFHLPVPGMLSAMDGARLFLTAFVSAFVLRGITRRVWRIITPPERTVVIGAGPEAEAFLRKIELFPDVHIEVIAELPAIDLEQMRSGEEWWRSVDRIVVASESLDGREIAELAALGQAQHVRLSVVPLTRGLFGTAVQLNRIADLPVLEYRTWAIGRSTLLLKRAMDLLVSFVALVLLAPVFALIALAIKIDSRGPVIYSQSRAGIRGRPFRMLKFRTMVRDAEEQLKELVPFGELSEPMFKLKNDPRVTRFGRSLRRWSIDELPQLFNVLVGQMSLVGPRPEQIDLVERYEPEHRFRLAVKPGMTGPMQIYGRGALSFSERLAVERAYVENLSLGYDFRILAMTIGAVLSGKGAL